MGVYSFIRVTNCYVERKVAADFFFGFVRRLSGVTLAPAALFLGVV